MQGLARTVCRVHTTRTLYRAVSTGGSRSEPLPRPSPDPSDSPAPDEQPEKIYARLPDPPSFSLSETKLRALIDLYHSSSSFITPENLSDEIDRAFATQLFRHTLVRPDTYYSLVSRRNERAAEPDRVVPTVNETDGRQFGTFDIDTPSGSDEGWSASKGERSRMVKSALWGVDPFGKIGLETLLEAKAEMDQFRELEGEEAKKENPEETR
ncbi:hypothetical protein FRC10_009273 [Ceratobasidium sp. 414]|nr:hypothetical protein FRC10_009273 [Ceratobasidium sp. 414]